jgi:hypothetical protein
MPSRKQERAVMCCERCGRSVVFLGLEIELDLCVPEERTVRRQFGCPHCSGDLVKGASVRSFPPPGSEVPSYEVLLVGEDALQTAEKYLEGCEACLQDYALIPFAYLLDEVTVADPTTTQYLLCREARCPKCDRAVVENTLVATVTG